MVRIGWLSDTHVHYDESAGMTQAALAEQYDWLLNNGCDWVFHAGDAVHSDTGSPDRMDDYDTFWGAFDQTQDGGDSLRAVIPGNHEPPLATFLDSDPRATLRERYDNDTDDVSVIFLNTQGNSATYGTPGRRSGPATEVPRVPYRDAEWLDEQLADANTAKLVVPHASPYWLNDSNYGEVLSNGNGTLRERCLYNVIQNYDKVHNQILTSYNNVVVPVSHLYQFSGEGSATYGGVDYIWKNHSVEVQQQNYHTFCYIDINGTGAEVVSVDHGTKSTTTLLSTTF